MSYEFADTLYQTRSAAIRGLILAWCDLPRLAELGETPAEIVAHMRSDAWLDDFEARYGEVSDADAIDHVEDLIEDYRRDEFLAEADSFDVLVSFNGAAVEQTAGEILAVERPEGLRVAFEDAIKALMAGEVHACHVGVVSLAVVTDEQIEALQLEAHAAKIDALVSTTSMALEGNLSARAMCAERMQQVRNARALDACRVLVDAYAAGESVSWESLNAAHECAKAALGRK